MHHLLVLLCTTSLQEMCPLFRGFTVAVPSVRERDSPALTILGKGTDMFGCLVVPRLSQKVQQFPSEFPQFPQFLSWLHTLL